MDLATTAQLLGNFGEFFGAIAVVITLGYLVVQIRQNTKMLRSNVYATWVQNASVLHIMRIENNEMFANMYGDGNRTFDDLNLPERQAHAAFFAHMMNQSESIYLQYVDGVIDDIVFEAKKRNLILNLSSHSLFLSSWKAKNGGPWDQRFVDYVNSEIIPAIEH